MVEINLAQLAVADAYKLLIGAIVPRPIAWVSTINKNGLTNLAPFSFFNAVCSNPPSLLFCPVNHPDGREKDTLVNIRQTQQFVVNLTTEHVQAAMNASSANYSNQISEFDQLNIASVASKRVKPPRVKAALGGFECELMQIIDIGDGSAGSGHIVVGKIVQAFFDETIYQDGKINLAQLKPIARLSGSDYCPVRETFSLPRPNLK